MIRMIRMSEAEVRGVLAAAAVAAAIYLLMAAAIELADRERAAAAAVVRADVAAYEVSRLLQEARDITRQAAAIDGDRP